MILADYPYSNFSTFGFGCGHEVYSSYNLLSSAALYMRTLIQKKVAPYMALAMARRLLSLATIAYAVPKFIILKNISLYARVFITFGQTVGKY